MLENMIICSENFNSFTLIGILEKMNEFIKKEKIKREDIINIVINSNGSYQLIYWSK